MTNVNNTNFIIMRKLISILGMMLLMFLYSCSSDDNESGSNQLEFIQILVTSEDTPTPNGHVYLFKIGGYEINDDKPNDWAIDYTPFLSYEYNGERRYMYPISEYGSKYRGDLLINKDKGYSVHTFYWSMLSSLYGIPKEGDEYLLFVRLYNGTYAKSSKRFVITKNSLITVKLPSCTDKSEFVNGEWSISDYK